NGLPPDVSAQWRQATTRDIGALNILLQMDVRGNLSDKRNDLSRIPAATRDIIDSLGDQIQQSYDAVSIPLPNGPAQPGQTWQGRRLMPNGTPQAGAMNVTYTYRGVREHKGRDVAVLELRGTLVSGEGNLNVRGRTTGTALYDPQLQ